jgi:aminodeoxyfutalosine deaminase
LELVVTRLISAPWVLPITEPPIADGAVVVDAHDTLLDVGRRAELVRRHPDAAEDRADGILLPALVNAHCHLELSALADAVPGGEGLVAWAGTVMAAGRDVPPERRRAAAAEAAGGAVRTGTAAIGDVGNTLAAVPGIGAAGLCGVLFHELLGSREAATGDALADAASTKKRARQAPGPRSSAGSAPRTPLIRPAPSCCVGSSPPRAHEPHRSTSPRTKTRSCFCATARDAGRRC